MTASGSAVGELAEAMGELLVGISGPAETPVTGLAYDSASVAPGDLFFCVVGRRRDGHEFAADAVRSGAAALCVERPLGLGVPELLVADARRAMGRAATAFWRRPADDLLVLGITGTNGKTTTAFLVESILRAAGHSTGLVGTVETRVAGAVRPGVRTTPESVDLQGLLAEMRDAAVGAVAMEVTSHALVLHRTEGMTFDAAAFTNLSQDHLDFHSDMEDYFAAKRSLFVPERARRGAVNVDDPYGRRLREEARVPVIGFGVAPDADVRALDVDLGPAGTRVTVATPEGELHLSSTLVGDFNVSNCLAASALALQAGLSGDAIAAGVAALGAVPGRFEAVDRGQPFAVVVDYAHTPDSLANVLREARRVAVRSSGRVVCVFGCGGDRDRGKRPLMGAAAARLADVVVVTSDNPRSEDPEAIVGEVLEGVAAERPRGADAVLVDRRAAIAHALGVAAAGDVVVIAGKGHETGQEFASYKVPFDDRTVAAEALAALGWEDGA